ncbi:MAG TPA: PfkB family carbohydrate kinase [Myxococcota bacterium]|jgi:D-beta-D-heptose 7-phosphate kinase/D-beta-D-heptose 1-phosphate adenosyltransferase|nr:PfkB family carbohydrate kinase [Myxococcota bacterium]
MSATERPARRRLDAARLERAVDGFARLRLLVVGDVVLDEYLWGDVDRVSPEAPVPVVHVTRDGVALGGAGNVVRNVVALGARCAFCSVVGDDGAGRRVIDLLKDLGVDPAGVVVVEGRPTTRKTRVVARTQQIVRFDRETEEPIARAASRRLVEAIGRAIPEADGVVLEDYGKGALAPHVLAAAMRRFRDAGLFVAVDPKSVLAPFRGASLVKPNLREAESLSGLRVRTRADLARAAERIRRRIGGGAVAITRGSDGIALFSGGLDAADAREGLDVRTARREVFDVQGAGDTTIAALVLALRAGASWLEAAVIANAAAGVVVGKTGTATASAEELKAALPAAVAAAEAGLAARRAGDAPIAPRRRAPAAGARRKA